MEDSGTYSCWIVHESGHSLYPILGQFDVSVAGPITKLDFYCELNGTVIEVQKGVALFELLDDRSTGKYVFQLEAASAPSQWDIFIGSPSDPKQRNITGHFEVTSPDIISVTESGLVAQQKNFR